MDTLVLVNQQRLTFIGSVQTLDAVSRTSQERLLRGMDVEKESKESVLSKLLDHDDNDISIWGYFSNKNIKYD